MYPSYPNTSPYGSKPAAYSQSRYQPAPLVPKSINISYNQRLTIPLSGYGKPNNPYQPAYPSYPGMSGYPSQPNYPSLPGYPTAPQGGQNPYLGGYPTQPQQPYPILTPPPAQPNPAPQQPAPAPAGLTAEQINQLLGFFNQLNEPFMVAAPVLPPYMTYNNAYHYNNGLLSQDTRQIPYTNYLVDTSGGDLYNFNQSKDLAVYDYGGSNDWHFNNQNQNITAYVESGDEQRYLWNGAGSGNINIYQNQALNPYTRLTGVGQAQDYQGQWVTPTQYQLTYLPNGNQFNLYNIGAQSQLVQGYVNS